MLREGIGELDIPHLRVQASLYPAFDGTTDNLGESRMEIGAKGRKNMEAITYVIESTMGARDPYTVSHQQRATHFACVLAEAMGLPEERIWALRMAGTIHDLGKVSVPQEILVRPRKLTEIEYAMVKNHPRVGYDILQPLGFPAPINQIVLQHHERMNGSGYPQHLQGEEIILEARILGVADVMEAMTSHRPYRPALGFDKAIAELSQNRGVLYDNGVVEACLKLHGQNRLAAIN